MARFAATQPCRRWQPEPPEIRQLRASLSRLKALQDDLQRETNRREKVQMAIGSAHVEPSIEPMIERLEQQVQRPNQPIEDHFDQHPRLKHDRQRLQTIPGVGLVAANHLLAIYHRRPFSKASQMAAYIGLLPRQGQSGTRVNRPARRSKAGPAHLRAKRYMPAIVASRYNADAKVLYERLVKAGKAKKAALGAVMRKLVHIAFGVLKHQQPYAPQVASSTSWEAKGEMVSTHRSIRVE